MLLTLKFIQVLWPKYIFKRWSDLFFNLNIAIYIILQILDTSGFKQTKPEGGHINGESEEALPQMLSITHTFVHSGWI